MARKYILHITIEADDFQSMLNLLHVVFQDVAAGTIEVSGRGATADGVLTISGSVEAMEEYRQEYLSYRDAADEEAR
jgi:hypothetical protein